MRRIEPVKIPSRKEIIILRLMILIGLSSMYIFLSNLLNSNTIGYASLYWMLISFIIFLCLKIIHEWVHYWYIIVPNKPVREKIYTVDIFTTFCKGEPYEMIIETLHAIQQIKYPHTAYLCDESNDPYLKDLCNQLGVIHVTREDKKDAKAGNINNALKQSTGELCVVLDPDHVPFPEFLDEIVDHFNDPEVGFVQIVQAYKNFDDGLIAKGACQQTFQFYGPMMMTMNKYGTVLAIGANCTFRRTALDSIGGHAAGLAEDMNTAMHLHANGWKSVYVPKVLSRGLVPNTISAYYSQQLKWARGVFELLFTTYPKYFRKFSWKQKIHYGVIPIYYLSGVFFLINFLVPILSLFLDVIPFKMGMTNFTVLGFPLVCSIVFVRHFVQKWVMEDEERGFHVVGGLLIIGTWWVFMQGFIYAIIRKKVPYIPTPKTGEEYKSWKLFIPNLLIIFLSIFSVCFGLMNDWNPYNLIMAGFAILNCLILSFSIYAGWENVLKRKWSSKGSSGFSLVKYLVYYKARFWQLRRNFYLLLRNISVLISLLLIAAVIFFLQRNKSEAENFNRYYPFNGHPILSGIFSPLQQDGRSSMEKIRLIQRQNNVHFNIVSLYIPWGDKPTCNLPFLLLDSIYQNESVPMITWEPWQSLFETKRVGAKVQLEQKVFQKIIGGEFDAYISLFASQVKLLKRPIYLRFAHEADNLAYPWSAKGGNSSTDFKKAWKYLHDFFAGHNVNNVIWVWNPWKPEAVSEYFPGNDYVDWIGVTCLNYSHLNQDKKNYSLDSLYAPFHQNPIFQSGIPVMLAETGSLQSGIKKEEWISEGLKTVLPKCPEIGAFVIFNQAADKNSPDTSVQKNLNWELSFTGILSPWLKKNTANKASPLKVLMNDPTGIFQTSDNSIKNIIFSASLKGVNYSKGQNWIKNYHALTKNELIKDFNEIYQAGFNAIKWSGPSFYDNNILREAANAHLKVNYSFWIPEDYDYLQNEEEWNRYAETIIQTIDKYKDNPVVFSWNIGNPVFQKMQLYYPKPMLLYKQESYIQWLKTLVDKIKLTDPSRPLTLDIDVDNSLLQTAGILKVNIPAIDQLGLIIHERSTGINLIQQLSIPFYFSKLSATDYLSLNAGMNKGSFIANWQDEETRDYISLDGLKDKAGMNKLDYFQLLHSWQKKSLPVQIPEISILKPAVAVYPGTFLQYHVLKLINNHWVLATANDSLNYKWCLVKNDQFGNPISMKDLGKGSSVSFTSTDYPQDYSICLYVSNGNYVNIIRSSLNMSLQD